MYNNSYTILSEYYDKLNYDCDYDKWSQYLYFLLQKYLKSESSGVDAACGSGKMTILLNKMGLDIFGFDISPYMLNFAKINACKNGVNIEFLCADMVNFKAHKKLGFINCACDGINYIEKSSISRCLKNLYNNLSGGGILLFDISSGYKLKNIIGNNTFSDDTDEVTYIWNNIYENENERVLMDLIFFVKDKENYKRFDENHIQYIYSTEFLTEELYKAGFKTVYAYDFLTTKPPKVQSQRIQFTALK